jgi:hypothetical protein
LNRIESVYLLPMSGGLDQYLANRLARDGRFRVVTDPARAEAVFTDRVGIDFEDRMTQLYPPPEPPKPEKKEGEEEERNSESIGAALGEVSGSTPRISSLSRGKGNVFLVDRETRQVVWSYYARPRSSNSDELDHIAEEIAKNLRHDSKRLAKSGATAPVAPTTSLPAAPPPEPAPAPTPVTPAVPPAK